MLKKLRKNKKGFTLAELLIVVAIIGVLVAISIPIFTAQLEKAREATDMANIRSAYAECSTAVLTGESDKEKDGAVLADDGSASVQVTLTQTKEGWLKSNSDVTLAGKKLSDLFSPTGTAGQKVTVKVDKGGNLTVTAVNAGNAGN
ncbi:MAG: prepilin-type N-terminal cleavage/methylation domain-containing protein [Lachnospiraceae bacterium]|jgi:prepilin-type N-terminal cleavage/methylation domain-containing protein|nr:prepilin-type N-terminal cleavage/methylation domain-containing protein [Lachnospiraceae bacterium]MCI1398007.1 prepilin-type N-terminal cleavage/methylation domain-containing protein [Lachnospiraceae bacterium]MCI1424144.1 prepilin-type N-terminal cleavage/methylation domain-containing protein [Lachnospiraceae bacterium]MCI1452932.1 prepilin-type N-terminal cleavage/methylation domain-containing protein [Lachnospiraceae bacterium]